MSSKNLTNIINHTKPSQRIARRSLWIMAILGMATQFITPNTSEAAVADKAGTIRPDFVTSRQMDIEIKFQKPASAEPQVELVILVDTSRSIESEINTMRNTILNFINDEISKHPGAIMVGITKVGNGVASYDSNNSNNPGANHQMFQSGSTNPLSNSAVGVDKVVTIDSSNINSLVSAVQAIAVETPGNPNSPDLSNSYTSDIGPGLARGSAMFHSGSSRDKFMILLTDGQAIKGYCPITGAAGNPPIKNPNIAWPNGAQLQIVPGGPDLTVWLPTGTGHSYDPIFPTSYPTTHGEPGVCRSYILNGTYPQKNQGLLADNLNPVRNFSRPQNSFLEKVAEAFGGLKSSNINTGTLDKIKDKIVNRIVVNDTLNSALFENINAGAYLGLFKCETNELIPGTIMTPSGVSFSITIPTAAVQAHNGEFCVRFRLTTRTTAPKGSTEPINSNSPTNRVNYYNSKNDIITYDTIAPGSVIIPISANLVTTAFNLATNSGASRSVFNVNENIYLYAAMQNQSSSSLPAGTKTAFYKNRASQVNANEMSDIPFYILNHGSFSSNQTRTYSSWNGSNWANGQNSTSPSSVVGAPSYWQEGNAADYSARVFANFQNSTAESNYPADNQRSFNYSVIRQPNNLNASSPSCTTANLTWTAGSGNIIGYRLVISSGGSPVQTHNLVGNVSNRNLTGLTGNTTYTWTLQANTNNGYSPNLVNGSSFTTSSCKSFDTNLSPGTIIQPGGDPGTQPIALTFLPNGSAWGSDTVTISVVGIVSGTQNCSSLYTPSSPAVTSGSGGASGITANMPPYPGSRTGTTVRTYSSGSPFAINLQASSGTSQGTYTICVSSNSAAGAANDPVTGTTFEVRNANWLQIDANSVSRSAGDVHSNGGIAFTIPSSQYFFKTVAGLVSANSGTAQGLAIDNSRLAAAVQWKVAAYTPAITSPNYNNLLSTITDNLGAAPNTTTSTSLNPSNSANLASIASLCGQPGDTTRHFTGNLTMTGSFSLPSNCNNRRFIYFVDGNLTLNHNVQDDSDNSGIVFIVDGNISVAPSVTRLDGAFVFGGSFITQPSSNALTISGTLLGLAGNNPGSGGNFRNGAQSGFQRDLGIGNNNPAETIRYQPKFLEILKNSLGKSTFSWVE